MRNSGLLGINFDLTDGTGVITVDHVKYSTNANGTWELWASGNSGSTYTKVGSSSTALSTAAFTVNLTGPVRLKVRKTDGDTGRFSFDNITVQSYAGDTTTPLPAPTSTGGGKKFLFDASYAETASNAD